MADLIADRAPDMAKMLEYWDLVDAISGGIDTMQQAGEVYLPKFPEETREDYKFRLSQTKMTNIFSDIIESLASKPYEKPVELTENQEINEFIGDFVDDVDGAGNNLSVFSADYFEAAIKSGIDWIFVDYPVTNLERMTLEDKRRQKIRPFWSRITARNVLEARTVMVGGDEALAYFRYLEPGSNGTPDRVRILTLSDGNVTWELHERGDKYNNDNQTYFNRIDGGTMGIDEIPIVPFFTGRRIGRTFELKPPMKAAADAQRDLYHQESALKYAKVLAAFPMLSGNGVKPEKEPGTNKIRPIGIGPNRVLYAPANENGQIGGWKYVEPNANSLQFLAADIQSAIRELRELGRQPLTAQTQNLTTVTTAFAAGKSRSSVAAWAGKMQDALENALRITNKWEGIDNTPLVSVYTGFDEFTDGKDLEVLDAARDRGDLSQVTYWDELKRRSVLSDSFNSEREIERLSMEAPPDSSNITNG